MAEDPNLSIIRELLSKAFDDDGINNLAFDEFYSVWNNFSASMTRSHQIRLIVDYAYKYGRIPQLLDYVKRHNPHQFEAYADRLVIFELVPERNEAEQLATYLDWVVEQYDSLYVLDMARARPLQDVYTAVELLAKPTAYRHLDLDSVKDATDSKHLDGLEIAGKESRLFVQGAPGAGKTTFLKHLAVQAARNDERLPFVPVYVPLNGLAESGLSLLDFAASEFAAGDIDEPQGFMRSMAQSGQLLLLLDALDEVPTVNGRRKKIEHEIINFARQNRYRECHIVITCRTAAIHSQFEKFTHVQIANFDATQMESFVAGWFREDASKQAAMLHELAKPENKRIKELAQTPLLLALLCIAYQDAPQAVFPQRRADVYQRAFDVLLSTWDSKREVERTSVYHDFSPEVKQKMLAYIAYETFKAGELLFSRSRLEKLIRDYLTHDPNAPLAINIPAGNILQAMVAQHGIFTMQARDVFEFSHLAFQEYFTAKYVADDERKEIFDSLVDKHLTDDRWREVFLLTVSLLDNADRFFSITRKVIDHLISYDVNTVMQLGWIEGEVQDVEDEWRRLVAKLLYLSAMLLDNARKLWAHGSDTAIDKAIDCDNVSFAARNVARGIAHNTKRGIDHEINSVMIIADNDDMSNDSKSAYTIALTTTAALATIVNSTQSNILANIEDQDFRFNFTQLKRLNAYLHIIPFILQCLYIARVSDRKAIAATILQPLEQIEA